ncbi:hypothetical protein [Streptomyces sp. NPDC000983]|uniref:hypothetical protein n=1 Tax=Streptomyces sp. NPDC000983 TaxID=3154373 RepID=UPI00332BA3FC
MSDDDSGDGLVDHIFEFDFQPGWVNLSLEERTWIEASVVATLVASRQFDQGELEVTTRMLIRDLRRRSLNLNLDTPNLAMAYYTPQGRAVAGMTLNSYADEGKPRPLRDEVVPLVTDFGDTEVVREPDTRHLDLPVGPALRIRAGLRLKGGFLSLRRGRTLELLKYAVFPPGVRHMSVFEVTWYREEDTEEVMRLTDELAASVKIVMVDDDGNPVKQ